jgi:hypothetical protein
MSYETVVANQSDLRLRSIADYMEAVAANPLGGNERAQHAFGPESLMARTKADLYRLQGVQCFRAEIQNGALVALAGDPALAAVGPSSPQSSVRRRGVEPRIAVLNQFAAACGLPLRVASISEIETRCDFARSYAEGEFALDFLSSKGLGGEMIHALPFVIRILHDAGLDTFNLAASAIPVLNDDDGQDDDVDGEEDGPSRDVGFFGIWDEIQGASRL